jgi:class 3 adenylate cyclase/CheY-like chemotaxis protein
MKSMKKSFIDDAAIKKADDYRRRKTTSVLTVVFTDIVNSTKLREDLGEIDYELIREEHDSFITKIFESDDAGTIVKSTGDGVLAVFSEPSTAVERCVAIQQEMKSHEHLRLRIGIDMGQVTVKSTNNIVKDIFGRHVNRAARIESITEPEHVLTSFTVYDCSVGWLRKQDIKWHNHGMVYLKGFSDPISVHEAINPNIQKPQTRDLPRFDDSPMFSKIRERYAVFEPPKPSVQEMVSDYSSEFPAEAKTINVSIFDLLKLSYKRNPLHISPPSLTRHSSPLDAYAKMIGIEVKLLSKVLPKPLSVLWVDDHPEYNSVEHEILNSAGISLVVTTNTQEAMDQIRERNFLFAITDMGRKDNTTAGLAFISQCRLDGKFFPIIVFTSERASNFYGDDAIEAGASLCTAGFVSLLVGIDEVLQDIRRRLPTDLKSQKTGIFESVLKFFQ